MREATLQPSTHLACVRCHSAIAAAKAAVGAHLSHPLVAATCLLQWDGIHCSQADEHLVARAEQGHVGYNGPLQYSGAT